MNFSFNFMMLSRTAASSLLIPNLSAWAHSPLSAVIPQDKAVVHTAPKIYTMTFNAQTRIIKFHLAHKNSNNTKWTLVVFDKTLLKQFPTPFNSRHTIQLPKLQPGRYQVSWRAMAKDHHIMTGTQTFTYQTPKA